MKTEEYEAEVKRTAGSNSRVMTTLGLAGEVGEVVEVVKKLEFHGKPYDRDILVKELGDVYWYFTALRVFEGISLDEIMQANVAKLRARYPDGFSSKDSQERRDVKTLDALASELERLPVDELGSMPYPASK